MVPTLISKFWLQITDARLCHNFMGTEKAHFSKQKRTLRPARGKTMSGGLGLRLGGWARLLQNLHSTLNGIDDHFLHLQPRREGTTLTVCIKTLTCNSEINNIRELKKTSK
ncbi:unnamed protein product [Urochloa humidicola]